MHFLFAKARAQMTIRIQKNGSTPIYIQIANGISSKIISGEWPPNYKLPAEVEFAKKLGVSRGSLRKAIQLLVGKNLLEQVHGKGTFVKSTIMEQMWAFKLTSTAEELTWKGIPFRSQVLAKQVLTSVDDRIASMLRLARQEPILYVKRILSSLEEHLVLYETFLPVNRYPVLATVDFSQQPIIKALEETCGIKLSWASHSISAIYADADVAKLLGVRLGAPVIFDEHILHDSRNHIVAFTRGWYRSDRFRLKTIVHRGSTPLVDDMIYLEAIYQSSSMAPISPQGDSMDIKELLPPDRIATNVQASTWEEAVRAAGNLLVKTGVVEARYVDAMVKTTQELGAYIVIAPGLAIPHARPEDGVIKPCFALITLANPIPFGHPKNDPVSLLIALGALDKKQHIEALQQMAEILSNPDRFNALKAAQSKEEILRIVWGEADPA
jgi:DNA-binding GntR family transcriptional regulator/mannitol/fructose-specific phosphotransferase system IIA component (Ntr-type)